MSRYLGDVSAYAYAVSKGYTGTEEEFAELMASYADVGQTAVEASQTATTKASEASASASTASSAAATATAKAQEATQDAQTASTASQTATAKASEASASASTASTAATTATTKAQEASESATTAQTAQTAAQTAQTAAESARDEAQASAESIDPDTLKNAAYNAYVVENASGAVASFSDGANDIPVKDLTIAIEPVQEGNGDPSPDNVRPITGWTGAKVTRTGKNILDVDKYGNPLPKTQNGITWSKVRDGVYHVQGTATQSSYFNLTFVTNMKNAMTAAPFIGKHLFCSVTDSKIIPSIGYFKEDGSSVNVTNGGIIPDDAYCLRCYVRTEAGTVIDADFSCQLELGSTATPYEPYNGETVEVDWTSEAGTVYGGTLDVTTGELAIDRSMMTLDGSQNVNANGATTATSRFTYAPSNKAFGVSNIISDRFYYKDTSSDNVGMMSGRKASRTVEFYLPVSVVQTIEGGKAWFSENPTQLCYELDTPITVQLTPRQINTLLGSNNIFADTGDVDVDYRADTKLYIDSLTAPDTDMVADANIESGKYFVVNNRLYLATSAIASGAEIVPGTNCKETNIAEALNAINL